MYRVEIDRSLCEGMASCVKIAPETFDLDGEGIAVLSGPAAEAAVEAAECCPFAAIRIFDQVRGERVV